MFQELCSVKYITSKNCFCFLSRGNFNRLQRNFLSLAYNDKETAFVSVVPASGGFIDDQSIGISSLYAKVLGVEDGSLVVVSETSQPPTIQTVTIIANNENDHYVLESLASEVQDILLKQIRVLYNGQKFIIYIGNNIYVTVTVCDIKPISPGNIENLTEVIIKPPVQETKHSNSNTKINITDNVASIFAEYNNEEKNIILRMVPCSKLLEVPGELCQPFNAFVLKSTLTKKLVISTTNTTIYLARLLSSAADTEKLIYVRLHIVDDVIRNFKLNETYFENIFVSEVVFDHFGCDLGSRILLELYNGPAPEIKEIEICTKRNYSIDVVTTFKQYLAVNCKSHEFIINSEVTLDITNALRCFVRFQPSQHKFCIVNPDFVRDCKLLIVTENLPQKKMVEHLGFSMDKYATEAANYQEIIDKCLFLFTNSTKPFAKMTNVIITGKPGTGKTVLVQMIANILNNFPHFIYTKRISCKSIKGKTVESLHKLFLSASFHLIHHQPSVLIVDDFHVLCENTNDSDAIGQNTVYFNRVSQMLEELFKSFFETNAVGILATANSTSQLNEYIYATRGNHLFKNVFSINQLSKRDRKILLEFLFSIHNSNTVDLEKLTQKSESFVIQDLADLVNKILFESYKVDYDKNSSKITEEHCDTALQVVTSTLLAGVNLHPLIEKILDDIGGLSEAKKVLIETLLWPSKYPNLFENAPLRLPSGLLLYGPPGTGKTILAGAAAKHCGLRLISIKGPELLSKYIGASEQAVRDVFQRAQSAKPCVLFFDEFDSLVPRRGHDNTGVTDRVVNQFLTQMDGIESLVGVFVLAATSRPDLLDPALLRPGRLDLHVNCPLPDEPSRFEILKTLSKSLKFCSDVNLPELAHHSEGFSGADLQAVLYTAQLDSVKDLLENEENVQEFQSEINQTRLMEALKNTRPSLSKAEHFKYEQIYRNFEGGATSDFKPGSRATLA